MDLNFKDPEQIKQLIIALQNLLVDNKEQPAEEDHFSPKIKTKTRSAKTKNTKNKFLSMQERNMHKDDTEIDRKLSISPPTPRTRKFEPVSVVCRVCGKKEKVSPNIITDSVERYKCNKCAASAGG